MSKLLLIGIDQSLTKTAIDTDQGVIRFGAPDTSVHMTARLFYWQDVLREKLGELMVRPHDRRIAFIEGYAFGSKRGQTAGEIGALLRIALYDLGWDIYIAGPSTLKKFLSGAGNAPKGSMQMHLRDNFGIVSTDDNDCDAKALRLLGCCALGIPYPNPLKTRKQPGLIMQFTKDQQVAAGKAEYQSTRETYPEPKKKVPRGR